MMLLCCIINALGSQTKLEDSNADTLLSYFFYQATDSRINRATAVVRGLVYLLVRQQPSLIWHVRALYDRAGKQLFQDINAWAALYKILEKYSPRSGRVGATCELRVHTVIE